MNQPNTDEQVPLPVGRGQTLHALVFGRGHALGRGALGHLPPSGGD